MFTTREKRVVSRLKVIMQGLYRETMGERIGAAAVCAQPGVGNATGGRGKPQRPCERTTFRFLWAFCYLLEKNISCEISMTINHG